MKLRVEKYRFAQMSAAALCLFMLIKVNVQAQDDVVIQAMKDEAQRTVEQLQLPGQKKPFFVMYNVLDQKSYAVTATLGGILSYNEDRERINSNTRLLVGDYEFNDETLDDNINEQRPGFNISMPVDNDYDGIRRSLWSITEGVYRSATRHYNKHVQTVEGTTGGLSAIPHRSFAKGAPANIVATGEPFKWNREKWEGLTRDLSALFKGYSEIKNSSVVLNFVEGHRYIVNSEGVVARLPFSRATLLVVAQGLNKENEVAFERFVYQATTPDGLPSAQEMKTKIEAMIAGMIKNEKAGRLEDDYTGPVLFMNGSVADLTMSALLRGKESIIATDNLPRKKGVQYYDAVDMSAKMEKPIVHESLTIIADPRITDFQGQPAFGSYPIDEEGIVPVRTTIVENGVLKALLNNRTLLGEKESTGGFAGGPGVITLTCSRRFTNEELKKMLILKAKEEGLDFGLMVRNEDQFSTGLNMLSVYKIHVADGREELVKYASVMGSGFKMFKKILGASKEERLSNLGGFMGAPSSSTVSVIAPQSLLVDQMEVKAIPVPRSNEPDTTFVKSPVNR